MADSDNPFGDQAIPDTSSTPQQGNQKSSDSSSSQSDNPFGDEAIPDSSPVDTTTTTSDNSPTWAHAGKVLLGSAAAGPISIATGAANLVPHAVTEINSDLGTNIPSPYKELSPYDYLPENVAPKTNFERYVGAAGGGASTGALIGGALGGPPGALLGAGAGAVTGPVMQGANDAVNWLLPGQEKKHPLLTDLGNVALGVGVGKAVPYIAKAALPTSPKSAALEQTAAEIDPSLRTMSDQTGLPQSEIPVGPYSQGRPPPVSTPMTVPAMALRAVKEGGTGALVGYLADRLIGGTGHVGAMAGPYLAHQLAEKYRSYYEPAQQQWATTLRNNPQSILEYVEQQRQMQNAYPSIGGTVGLSHLDQSQ